MDGLFTRLTTLLEDLTANLQGIVNTVGVLIIIVCGIGYMTASTPQSAEKFKSWGFRVLLAVVIINAASLIISYVANAAGGETSGIITAIGSMM